jgi:hypothetical protein
VFQKVLDSRETATDRLTALGRTDRRSHKMTRGYCLSCFTTAHPEARLDTSGVCLRARKAQKTGEKLQNEELHRFYSTQGTIKMIKNEGEIGGACSTYLGRGKRNACRILVGET